MNVSSLLIVAFEVTAVTERSTACVIRINGRGCLCFPGAIDPDKANEYFELARWPESVADPFPPALPTSPSQPGWVITSMCSGPDGDIRGWSDFSAPPIATGALARCLAAFSDTDGKLREPTAEQLAELVPDYQWSAVPKSWPPILVLEAVQAMQGAGHD